MSGFFYILFVFTFSSCLSFADKRSQDGYKDSAEFGARWSPRLSESELSQLTPTISTGSREGDYKTFKIIKSTNLRGLVCPEGVILISSKNTNKFLVDTSNVKNTKDNVCSLGGYKFSSAEINFSMRLLSRKIYDLSVVDTALPVIDAPEAESAVRNKLKESGFEVKEFYFVNHKPDLDGKKFSILLKEKGFLNKILLEKSTLINYGDICDASIPCFNILSYTDQFKFGPIDCRSLSILENHYVCLSAKDYKFAGGTIPEYSQVVLKRSNFDVVYVENNGSPMTLWGNEYKVESIVKVSKDSATAKFDLLDIMKFGLGGKNK